MMNPDIVLGCNGATTTAPTSRNSSSSRRATSSYPRSSTGTNQKAKLQILQDVLKETTSSFQAPRHKTSERDICLFCNCMHDQIGFSVTDPWNPIWQTGRLQFQNIFNFDL